MANEKKKILLVDDDELHLTTAELFLQNEYEVYKTKSGKEALEFLTNNKIVPNLILLDILMPNMDGWGVLIRLQAVDFLKCVPIVFLTTVKDESERERAYKMGIADYITKPFNRADLLIRVKNSIK